MARSVGKWSSPLRFLSRFLVPLVFLVMVSCGHAGNSTDTGNAVFAVRWTTSAKPVQGNTTAQSVSNAPIDCAASGVSTVSTTVYDSSNTVLVSGGPWSCTDHGGIIYNIPEGSNRKFVVQGKDSSGTVNYQGEQTGISITAGVTNNVGSIAVAPLSTGTGTTIPDAPMGVDAVAADGQVTISWTAVTGATSYNVYYGPTADVTITNGTKVTGAVSGSAITGLTNNTTNYFVVTAVNTNGESAISNEVSATPQVPTSAPSAPTGVIATLVGAQVTVTWTAVTGATSYNVYYRITTGVTIANGTKVAGATFGGTITGLANGTTYYFVVTAVNAIGESAVSSEVSATPPLPPYTNNGNGTITTSTGLIWQQQDDGETRDWYAAQSYCIGLALSGSGWRLPIKDELLGIVDTSYSPTINPTYFTNTQSSGYWSSTAHTTPTFSTTAVLGVSFSLGVVAAYYKTDYMYVRCVRP